MATTLELAKVYAERIKNAKNRFEELAKIEKEIDALIYSTTKKPVSNEFKLFIYEEIKRLLSEEGVQKAFSRTQENKQIFNATDNSSILTTINTITNKLKGK